jgi:hypothetical protein
MTAITAMATTNDNATNGISYSLNANWLSGTASSTYIHPYSSYYTYYWPQQRVKLSFDDVKHLRALAKKDAKLREILRQFTDYIEVTAPFGEAD